MLKTLIICQIQPAFDANIHDSSNETEHVKLIRVQPCLDVSSSRSSGGLRHPPSARRWRSPGPAPALIANLGWNRGKKLSLHNSVRSKIECRSCSSARWASWGIWKHKSGLTAKTWQTHDSPDCGLIMLEPDLPWCRFTHGIEISNILHETRASQVTQPGPLHHTRCRCTSCQ